MIRYFCRCGAEIFFDNTDCVVCGSVLGFDSQTQRLLALIPGNEDVWSATETAEKYHLCAQRKPLGCNWLIDPLDNHEQCLSCRTTRIIPALTLAKNHLRWQRLEQTKRRALYMILRLQLPMNTVAATACVDKLPVLMFDFLEDRRSNPDVVDEFIYSGHKQGIITINAAEADDSYRATNRELMNELYRTLLGHFRHELGHYYGLLLTDQELIHFRQHFGDERMPYQEALDGYYRNGVRNDWRSGYISAYASAHPLEDWAETWAHYLHMADTLETAAAYGVINQDNDKESFEQVLLHWSTLTVALNALNRSMGVDDAYPFVINSAVSNKLGFIDRLVKTWRVCDRNAVATETHGAALHASNV